MALGVQEQHPRARSSSIAVVPIVGGRVVLGGASIHTLPSAHTVVTIRSRTPASAGLREAIDGRYVIAWSPAHVADLLARATGEDKAHWRKRAIDLRVLCASIDDGRDAHGAGSIARVARAHRVPAPRPADALERALAAAQLFLVVATKLAERGEEDVGKLVERSRASAVA